MLQFGYSLFLAWGAAAAGSFEPPRPLSNPAPKYTDEARRDRIQGTVLLSIRVSPDGRPEAVEPVSRVGGGLEEQAVKAVRGWVFAPGRVAGSPVPSWTVVEVNFRLAGEWFDAKQEKLRVEFAAAARQAAEGAPGVAVRRMEALARKKYAPALHWLGRHFETADPPRAAKLIAAAAARRFAPAIFDEGRLLLPRDEPAAVARMTEASVLGDEEAREFLGRYWAPRDTARSRRYFRLCAMAGRAECQYELGRLIGRDEKLQALAWFELAAANGHRAARLRLDAADARDRERAVPYRDQILALARRQ